MPRRPSAAPLTSPPASLPTSTAAGEPVPGAATTTRPVPAETTADAEPGRAPSAVGAAPRASRPGRGVDRCTGAAVPPSARYRPPVLELDPVEDELAPDPESLLRFVEFELPDPR